MPSFNFDIGERERVGSRFLSDVRDELLRALAEEKSRRKITQQQIAEKLETSRAVINRQLMGVENMGIKRAAEILWAIGWEPFFQARKLPAGQNQFIVAEPTSSADQTKSEQTIQARHNDRIFILRNEARAA
jgi:formamidopyrimidine-DNA glycosylase